MCYFTACGSTAGKLAARAFHAGYRLNGFVAVAAFVSVVLLLSARSVLQASLTSGAVHVRDLEWEAVLVALAVEVQRRSRLGTGRGLAFTVGEYLLVSERLQRSSPPLPVTQQLARIAFAIMGSSMLSARSQACRDTWMRWIPARNVVLVSNQSDAVIGAIDLRNASSLSLFDAAYALDDGSHAAAQRRSLRAFVHVVEHVLSADANIEWVIMADDDTWVDAPNIASVVGQFEPLAPLVIGCIFDGPAWSPSNRYAWPSGGAAIVMSAPAAVAIARGLHTPTCPFESYNDLTIGRCATALGIAQVHHYAFGDPDGKALAAAYGRAARHGWATLHRRSPENMTNMYREQLVSLGRGVLGVASAASGLPP